MAIDVNVLVLPAFDDLEGLPGEMAPWRTAYDLDRTVRIDGVTSPLRYTTGGLAVVPTGIGKTDAAATTTALCASNDLDLDDALVLSVGVAGGPPALPVGSVVLADCIVDWDDKCRFDAGSDAPLALNPYTDGAGVFDLDDGVVESAQTVVEGVDMPADTPSDAAGDSDHTEPTVVTGTNLCGDELWHGRDLAEQVSWLVSAYDRDPYLATEMEDAGTATALERFERLDQYLSVRGISNHDRPPRGTPSRDHFFDASFEAGFGPAIENAVHIARAIADDRLA